MTKIPQIDWSRPTAWAPHWAQILAAQLGYPLDIPLERHRPGGRQGSWIQADTDVDFGEWVFDIMGVPIWSMADAPDEPPDDFAYGYRTSADQPMRWVRSIITRVHRPGSEVFIQRTYHQNGMIREDICGVNTCKRDGISFGQMMREVETALLVMGATFPAQRRGRPLGSGMRVTTNDVTSRYWQWADTYGSPPSQNDPAFADLFFLSVRQFKARLRQLRESENFTWPPLRPSDGHTDRW